MKLYALLATLATAVTLQKRDYSVKIPEMADYRMLYDVLWEEVPKSSDNVPHWVRSAFHDLVQIKLK
jgi:hypothetical protein